MQFWYEHIWAEESGGSPFTETFTADFPSTDVLVTCALQQVNQQGLGGKAQIAITSYVTTGAHLTEAGKSSTATTSPA
jgi:hypothetical protein